MNYSKLSVFALVIFGCAAIGTAAWALSQEPGQETKSARLEAPKPTPNQMAKAHSAIEQKRIKLAAEGPKSMDQPQKAMEFFLEQRLGEGQTELPIEQLRDELNDLKARELALNEAQIPLAGGITSWTSLGPGNIGGRTRAIVFDPTNPDIMYASAVAGGIWKSTDGGMNWSVTDDLMLNLAVCALAIDSNNPNVLYAGTGEGYYLADVFVRGLGIFKSVDAGATWNQLSGTVTGVPSNSFYYVNKIVISPNDSNRIYAGTRTGVWRSTDAGQNWNVVLANPFYNTTPPTSNGSVVGCTDLVVRNDRDPDVLFASFGSIDDDGLFRSLTGGDTWQAYSVPSNQGRTTIALAPSNNDIMYLLMADNGSLGATGQLVQVFRSDDGGDSFTGQVDFGSLTGPWLLSNLVLATGCSPGGTYHQGWYDNIIAVDPMDPDIVWVGGVDIFRSDDAAVNFEIPAYWFYYQEDPPPPYQVHPDHHIIRFHPDYNGTTNQIMYVGNDGGLFRTTNARAATSLEDCPFPADDPLPEVVWERLNNSYAVTQFYHGDSARDVDLFVGGAQDNGTNRVQAANTPNDWDLIFGGDGGYVAIDPTDGQTVYIEYHVFPSIQKSTDGGDTFAGASTGITDTDGIFIPPFAMDQANPQVLWTGGRRPWRTTNGAASWHLAGVDLSGPDRISAIAVAPSNSNVVYLAYTNGYVARTNNGLSGSPTWGLVSGGLRRAWISSVAVDPVNPDIAYCTYSTYGDPHIYKTENGGQNWFSIDGIGFSGVPSIPVHWLAVRPCNSKYLYAATELGVFASNNGGTTWSPANTGLAHTPVESLDFKDEDTLVAFTHGRGAYITNLSACRLKKKPILKHQLP